jgi:transcriptional regulator with XRE-family HTH domain
VEFASLLRRLGANLRRARWAKGLTQEEVAARGLTYRHYQELERGTRNPTLRTLHFLARELDTTVAQLCDADPKATLRAAERLARYEPTPPKRGRKPAKKRR